MKVPLQFRSMRIINVTIIDRYKFVYVTVIFKTNKLTGLIHNFFKFIIHPFMYSEPPTYNSVQRIVIERHLSVGS